MSNTHYLWIEKRNEILKRDGHKCTHCGISDNLAVHHKCYQSGRMYWDYKDEYLETVCNSCHSKIHDKKSLSHFYQLGKDIDYNDTNIYLLTFMYRYKSLMIKRSFKPIEILRVFKEEKKKFNKRQVYELDYITGLGESFIIEYLSK